MPSGQLVGVISAHLDCAVTVHGGGVLYVRGSTVSGSISVEIGGLLTVLNSTIVGPVRSTTTRPVTFCSDNITGSVNITNSSVTTPSPEDRSLLSADDAITKIDQDRLGRADFARSLGTALAAWRGDQSLIVGLYGEWGSGKSSIKNMVIDSFAEMPQTLRSARP